VDIIGNWVGAVGECLEWTRGEGGEWKAMERTAPFPGEGGNNISQGGAYVHFKAN
jgi:hypothetical protein